MTGASGQRVAQAENMNLACARLARVLLPYKHLHRPHAKSGSYAVQSLEITTTVFELPTEGLSNLAMYTRSTNIRSGPRR